MIPDPERSELDARVLAWMREPSPEPDEARFDRLARDLFAHQFERCTPYARLCRARGRTPETVTSWREIPPVPAGAFKVLPLRCFRDWNVVKRFRTSGTTTGQPGTLELDTLELYEASLTWSFSRFVLPDLESLGGRIRIRVLALSPGAVPESSLSYMFGCVIARLGAPGSGFDLRGRRPRFDSLWECLEETAARDTPIVLCGTAFAFVHLVDEARRRGMRLALPASARIMETGGFKGRSRSVERSELYGLLGEVLGIPPERIVNQYGMTELASQFYDGVLAEPDAPRAKRAPPWTRVRIVDPETGAECAPGVPGAIQIFDLANTGSVLAVQPADLGVARPGGFDVLGRVPGAEERGCSLAADALLARAER